MTEELNQSYLSEDEKKLLEEFLSGDENELSGLGVQRRHFLRQLLAAGGGLLVLQLLGDNQVFAAPMDEMAPGELPPGIENGLHVAFKVNGKNRSLSIDPRMTLL